LGEKRKPLEETSVTLFYVKPKKRPSENQVNLEDRIVGNQKRHENA
jgi:hypothetical protein